jgi:hypothetical protein
MLGLEFPLVAALYLIGSSVLVWWFTGRRSPTA